MCKTKWRVSFPVSLPRKVFLNRNTISHTKIYNTRYMIIHLVQNEDYVACNFQQQNEEEDNSLVHRCHTFFLVSWFNSLCITLIQIKFIFLMLFTIFHIKWHDRIDLKWVCCWSDLYLLCKVTICVILYWTIYFLPMGHNIKNMWMCVLTCI